MSREENARDEREWERAFALRRDLAPFLDGGFQTRGALQDFCKTHGCSRATAYRYLHTAREVGRDNRVHAAWNNTINFEKALEASLRQRSKKKDKSEFHDFAFAFANILMKSRDGLRSPIDLFASAAFPARPNPRNIRTMDRPYRASSIAVQRKTHGLIAALLKSRVNLFTIKGLQQGHWGRDPTFQELRTDLEPEQNAELDRLLLKFAAKWF